MEDGRFGTSKGTGAAQTAYSVWETDSMTAQMKEKLREQQHVDTAIQASETLINFYTNALRESSEQVQTYIDDGNFVAALGELKKLEETEMVEHLTELLTRRKELQERSDSL